MTNDANDNKKRAAQAALDEIPHAAIIGVGTGSTVNYFIEALGAQRGRVRGAVSSSEGSTVRLRAAGIEVLDLNDLGTLELYVDGADEATAARHLIKGGGGALTREKIIAAASKRFVCIVDEAKLVQRLGRFPLPIEVIPMARAQVARQLPGRPVWREGLITDNGNVILDVHDLKIADACALEREIKRITGVVEVGLFAERPADVLLIGAAAGVRRLPS